jgi:hypothetical protein
MKTRTVALYGGNLVMSSIGTTLHNETGFHVQEFREKLPGSPAKPDADPPDVILFDLLAAQPDFAFSLLRDHPATILIGIDLNRNEMLVLTGATTPLKTADDLFQAIEKNGSTPILA